MKVTEDYKKVDGLGDLPAFGMIFTIPKDFKKIKFYGLGPADNYIDRLEGARLGTFETDIFAEVEPYLNPQESGNHCGVRNFAIVDERGRGIKFFGTPFEISALPNSPHEIENAKHQEELPPHKFTFVKINSAQCGCGGDDSWSAPTLEEYKIHNEDQHFEFCIKGI